MEIDVNYAARVLFGQSAFVQIYYEAIANAFDANANSVDIVITSDGLLNSKQLEISIADNGEGFTDERYERFRRLTEPRDALHKGLGRLVYLRYFEGVHVTSVYGGKKRTFVFRNPFDGKYELSEPLPSEPNGTTLRFVNFKGIKLRAYDDIKPSVLKKEIVGQFLPLLHGKRKSGSDFSIRVEIKTPPRPQHDLFPDRQVINASDVPILKSMTFQDEELPVEISMYYWLQQDASERRLTTAVNVDGRTVPIKLINHAAVPIQTSALFLFESDLFIGMSDSARQRLNLPVSIQEATLVRVLRRRMSALLNKEVPEIEQTNKSIRQQFENKYPHLLGLFEESVVGLIDSDDALEKAQALFFKKQKEVLDGDVLSDSVFEKSLEISSRTLAEYVLYRELIIKRLAAMTSENQEEDVHNLIIRKRKVVSQDDLLESIYSNNVWLLDDRYMTFRTVLSERKMHEVIQAITLTDEVPRDDGRPDISLIFSADPEGTNKVDVVMVELKKRKVDDKENIFSSVQLTDRARALVKYLPNIQKIWYYGIIEIDDKQAEKLEDMNFTPQFCRGGRSFHQDFSTRAPDGSRVRVPVCLISYSAILCDAQARNHAFLELLKTAIRRSASQPQESLQSDLFSARTEISQ